MNTSNPRIIESNGINMAVYEEGDGQPVILLHGFPELAYSWRHQLPALASAGYRAIAPDLRGYGKSDKPDGVGQYSMQKLVGDVTGLLDALELERAHIVAHDWGALIAWQLALMAPDRMSSLVALNIPFFSRPPIDPIAIMRTRLGDHFYIVNFQHSDEADKKCAEDPAWVFAVMMRRGAITRERFDLLPKEMQSFSILAALGRTELGGESLLSPEETAVYVEAFSAGGFTGPINYYRNFTHNWETTADIQQKVTVPSLFIGAVNDVIVSPEHITAMKPFVDTLEIHMLENCGHWSQQEKPDEVNALLLDWLAKH